MQVQILSIRFLRVTATLPVLGLVMHVMLGVACKILLAVRDRNSVGRVTVF